MKQALIFMKGFVRGGREVYNAIVMRRFLLGLTLAILLVVSIGVGVLVAYWPGIAS